ncbi:MAG: bacteriohopanetetrol glucosamine biosynthesis glycosyltransferase HpnI [Gammaproteobacteria bacterium]|nr:bacteriohopanetetrol glucosamine biosynthesis glycosyltransferase HpnI [Gammaproteobacteria bacterium]
MLLYLIVMASCGYLSLAFWQIARFKSGAPIAPGAPTSQPMISVMRPLCGAEPQLYECLRSFCVQTYPHYELIFGVSDSADPAVAVVTRLRREFPSLEISLMVNSRTHGANPKVSNLLNMIDRCQHDVLVVADSDVCAPPDLLADLAHALAPPGVGAVTTLYTGVATGGWVSRLGALWINDFFLPSALVDIGLNEVDGCYGPVTAIRRQTLDEVGGFPALKDYLAEDNRLGRLVRARGLRLVLNTKPAPTMVNSQRFLDLFRHELRWARTVRACRPLDHVLSVITYPLPLMLLALMAAPSTIGLCVVGLHVMLRMLLNALIHRRVAVTGKASPLWVPARECLSFMVWAVSLWGTRVVWRNREYELRTGGFLVPRVAQALAVEPAIGVGSEAQS